MKLKHHKIVFSPFHNSPIPKKNTNFISFDLICPFYVAKYIFAITDLHTFAFNCICRDGRSSFKLGDKETQFTSELPWKFIKLFEIKINLSTAYHLSGNRLSDIINKSSQPFIVSDFMNKSSHVSDIMNKSSPPFIVLDVMSTFHCFGQIKSTLHLFQTSGINQVNLSLFRTNQVNPLFVSDIRNKSNQPFIFLDIINKSRLFRKCHAYSPHDV